MSQSGTTTLGPFTGGGGGGGGAGVTSINGLSGVLTFVGSGLSLTSGPGQITFTNQGVLSVSATTPLASSGGQTPTLSIQQASSTQSGYLSSTDWNTFNSKYNLPSFTAGSVIFSNGTNLAQNNADFFWNNTDYQLVLTQPSNNLKNNALLVLNVDPSGLNTGYHIQLAGNPGEGAKIYRDATNGWVEISGGTSNTTGGTIYMNGNTSGGGDAGGVQVTLGVNTASFDVYDTTQSIKLFSVNNAGELWADSGAITTNGAGKISMVSANISSLTASQVVSTDASKNLISTPIASTNTANAIVQRDASGNFAAGTITANLTGNVSGTASNITATSNSTLTTLSALSLPGSQVTGDISGTASNITATSNSTLTTLSALSLPFSQTTGTVPVNRGGTNLTAAPTNGQLLIGNGTGYSLATLTAGAGIGIVNAAGSITITNNVASNIDGGQANSNYGGITPINAGGAN